MSPSRSSENQPAQERKLAIALQQVLAFPVSRMSACLVRREDAVEFAREEAAFGTVLIDDHGMSAGMTLHLLQPIRTVLADWERMREEFDRELQPKMADVRAVQDARRGVVETELQRDRELDDIERRLEANASYIKVRDQKDTSYRYWEDFRDRHNGRAPKMFAFDWRYKAAMLSIGVAEWFINYDTLLNFTGVPAIAAGSTVVLAVLLAFAAHGHGELLKQWSYRFRESREPMQRSRDWRLFGLSTAALLIVLLAAGAARYSAAMQVLATQTQHSLIGGDADLNASPVRDVAISMLANIAAWLVGIYVAYVSHDDDPDYMDATFQWNAAHRAWTASRKRFEQDIRHTRAKFTRTIEDRRAAADSRAASVKDELAMLEQVQVHEAALWAAADRVLRSNIETYRGALMRVAFSSNNRVELIRKTSTTPLKPHELNGMALPDDDTLHRMLAA
ncbi:MAG: hypothetical protein ACRYG8_03975 [Janthinobacterium lividum]